MHVPSRCRVPLFKCRFTLSRARHRDSGENTPGMRGPISVARSLAIGRERGDHSRLTIPRGCFLIIESASRLAKGTAVLSREMAAGSNRDKKRKRENHRIHLGRFGRYARSHCIRKLVLVAVCVRSVNADIVM